MDGLPWSWGRTISLTSSSAALLAHPRRHRPDPEVRDELAALVEVEAPLPGLHQLERRAAHEDELGSR
jgi:hypothetical protein